MWPAPVSAPIFHSPYPVNLDLRGRRVLVVGGGPVGARKAEGLAKIREDIRVDHDLVAQRGPESAEASTRLPGLLAFEKRIESVREWPFDAPTLTRFFLYVAIPLGSWVGGALVERLLGAVLD